MYKKGGSRLKSGMKNEDERYITNSFIYGSNAG